MMGCVVVCCDVWGNGRSSHKSQTKTDHFSSAMYSPSFLFSAVGGRCSIAVLTGGGDLVFRCREGRVLSQLWVGWVDKIRPSPPARWLDPFLSSLPLHVRPYVHVVLQVLGAHAGLELVVVQRDALHLMIDGLMVDGLVGVARVLQQTPHLHTTNKKKSLTSCPAANRPRWVASRQAPL